MIKLDNSQSYYFENSKCPISDLPVTSKPEWNIRQKDYSCDLGILDNQIILSRPIGHATSDTSIDYLKKLENVVSEIPNDKSFVIIDDLSNLLSSDFESYKTFINKLIDHKRLLGVIFFNVSTFLKQNVNLSKRFHLVPYHVEIANNYSHALQLASKLLKRPIGEVSLHTSAKFTSGNNVCNITGLSIESRPEWSGIKISDNCSVSFKIIGGNILYTIPKGELTLKALEDQEKIRSNILKEAIEEKSYVEILDFIFLTHFSHEHALEFLTKYTTSHEKELIAFIGLNAEENIKDELLPNIFSNKFSIPFTLITDYTIGIKRALEYLNEFKQNGEKPLKELKTKNNSSSLDELLNVVNSIKWNSPGLDFLKYLPKSNPFYLIFETLATVKLNIDSLVSKSQLRENSFKKQRNYTDLVFQVVPSALYTVDINKNITSWNKKAEEITGYSEEEVLGKKCIFHDTSLCRQKCILEDEKNISYFISETSILTKNNEKKIIKRNHDFIKDDHGNTMGSIISFEDITDLKSAQEDKERMQEQLFQTSKLASIGELSAGIAHEINNPLAIISGNVEVLYDELLVNNPELIKLISKAIKGVDRIKDIVDGLRCYSRISTQSSEKINAHEAIDDTLSLIGSIYSKEGIELEKVYNSPAPFFKGNKGKFQQVIMNILNNAKDAMEDGGSIKIESRNSDNKLKIVITDTGSGMTDDIMKKIFDSFYTTKEPGKGTGLGLGICKSIIEEMQGSITVASKIDVGTSFTITLPLSLHALDSEEPATVPEETNFAKLSGNVLIVDDEVDIRDLLALYLKHFGFQVERASDGISALEKIKNNHYDYVITDLVMPKMNGDDLIKEVKKEKISDAKFIIVTGCINIEDSENQINYLTSISDGFLQKPFTKEQIYRMITHA